MKREPLVVTCVGLNHRTAPLSEREKLIFSAEELPIALTRLRDELGGAVILSTCNRTELYATTAGDVAQADQLLGALAACKGTQVQPRLTYFLAHDEAVRHLFRVAAGVDSMVLGESQILGQVRDAMSAATEAGSLNGVLSRLLHSAIRVGKRARSETDIGRYSVSVSSAAVALARQTAGALDERTVLVISAGSTGELAARSLADSGVARILVANRTGQRATALAGEIGGEAVPFSRLAWALAESDIVISGTGADQFILGPKTIASAVANRDGRELVLIDIAVPRDVDPAVGQLPGVRLFDIDDIQTVSRAGMRGRRRQVLRVEAHVEDEVDDFMEWWRSLDVIPVIAALRERADDVRRRELERTLRALPDLDDEQRARIRAMSRAMVKKMLDRPIARLKNGASAGTYVDAMRDLFELAPALHGSGANLRKAETVSGRTFVVGSRGSRLSQRQTELAVDALRQAHPEARFEMRTIRTFGDKSRASLGEIGGRGVFVVELEQALLSDEIDIAVHSLKDMPSDATDGLAVAAVTEREDVRDVLVSRDGLTLTDLPNGAAVGTGSPRRAAQLLATRPDLRIADIRGNVDTRIRKVEDGQYDAAVLAAAGLARLGWLDRAAEVLSTDVMLPAVGQGALALQVRADDTEAGELVSAVDHRASHLATAAERAFEARLGGGCHAAIAALGEISGADLRLRGLVGDPAGGRLLRGEIEGPVDEAEALGVRLAESLLSQGAADLLAAVSPPEATR